TTATSAALLAGTSVTGNFTAQNFPGFNFFDPVNGLVPVGPLNKTLGTTVPIASPAVEFGTSDGTITITADFTDTTLALVFVSGAEPTGVQPEHFTFTDTAFTGLLIAKGTDTWANGGLSFSLTGDVLSINWAGLPAVPSDLPPGDLSSGDLA